MEIREHLKILGFKVRDRVTGAIGVATSISFDLYGCIQVVVNPGIGKDGKAGDSLWFDKNRLEIKSKERVMDPPDFGFAPASEGKKGAAEKPGFCKP